MQNTTQQNTRLIPIPKWNEYHVWPPIGGLRHIVFNLETNGFKTAFKKIGRIYLIDEAEFWACVERNDKNKAA